MPTVVKMAVLCAFNGHTQGTQPEQVSCVTLAHLQGVVSVVSLSESMATVSIERPIVWHVWLVFWVVFLVRKHFWEHPYNMLKWAKQFIFRWSLVIHLIFDDIFSLPGKIVSLLVVPQWLLVVTTLLLAISWSCWLYLFIVVCNYRQRPRFVVADSDVHDNLFSSIRCEKILYAQQLWMWSFEFWA